mmetsp:Transcript_13951/g.18301  ORF Transcript_13951/g.18301 Transcript_13951/m.18301 type:complete len:235 (-) Transcript_13951:389-1093(-)
MNQRRCENPIVHVTRGNFFSSCYVQYPHFVVASPWVVTSLCSPPVEIIVIINGTRSKYLPNPCCQIACCHVIIRWELPTLRFFLFGSFISCAICTDGNDLAVIVISVLFPVTAKDNYLRVHIFLGKHRRVPHTLFLHSNLHGKHTVHLIGVAVLGVIRVQPFNGKDLGDCVIIPCGKVDNAISINNTRRNHCGIQSVCGQFFQVTGILVQEIRSKIALVPTESGPGGTYRVWIG